MIEQVPRAKFRSMNEGTAEDWAVIGSHFFPYAKELPDRVLDHLKLLDGDYGGLPTRQQYQEQDATSDKQWASMNPAAHGTIHINFSVRLVIRIRT